MANFKVKNGLQAGRYLLSGGTETAGSVGYDLGAAEYDSKSFSVASQDTIPRGIAFNADGTKVYMIGFATASSYQYTLSTAFDISTASYDSVSFSFSSQDTSPFDIEFNSSGTKMYMTGVNSGSVHQYTLSTAYDLSTTSYDSVSFSVTSQNSFPSAVTFNTTGSKMYVVGTNFGGTVYQYSLSTAYDLSTSSYDSVSFSVNAQESSPRAITFNTDGSKMYIVGDSSDTVFEYSLSTSFDLSTASYSSVNFSVSPQESAAYGLEFNSDGTKMYVVGVTNDTIYQYSTALPTQTLDLSTGTTFSFTPSGATTVSFTNAPASGKAIGFSVEINGDGSAITWPSSVKWPSGVAPAATASKEVYAFVTTDGGTSYYGKLAGSDIA